MSRYIDADLFLKVFDDGEKKMDALGFVIPQELREATKAIYCEIRNIVNDIPTADVRENVKGEWIIHNSYGREYLECPHCRTYFLHEYLVRNSFCPNCGAEMSQECNT